jgi:DNA-binding MarR family transcriptional regulator
MTAFGVSKRRGVLIAGTSTSTSRQLSCRIVHVDNRVVYASAMDRAPLARLLTAAAQVAIARLNRELSEAGFTGVRPADGYALLALGVDGATTSQLGDRLGITKQAAAKVATRLEAEDLVRRAPHPHDGRAGLLTRTARADRLLAAAEKVQDEIERDWEKKLGRGQMRTVRQALETAIADDPVKPLQRLW